MLDFIERHWGDLISILVLYTGIGLYILKAIYGIDSGIDHLGEALVMAALVGLKLRPSAPRKEKEELSAS